jgi:predicted RNA binding protein with dsRBD fold (UPF0201 family)
MNIQVKGTVNVYPTENIEKVKHAVENIILAPEIKIVSSKKFQTITFESKGPESLAKLQAILKQDQIRDAFRKALYERIYGSRIRFYLNKQVAYVGHISICEPSGESPLGPIEIEIECDEPQKLIDWLSPATHKE